MKKKLLLGNEAVARGLYEAGTAVISSYPGTPSTEITEYAALYNDMYTEWAPNEKVALEVAIGASIAGKRAFSGMKHVGLNVAADPLYTVSYTGVNGGLVIGVADDPGMHSSQNEQDSRNHATGAKVPMLEPASSQECLDYVKLAFELSEQFDTPVLLRLSTRISHARSLVDTADRDERGTVAYEKDIQKYVMMPAMARPRHTAVEQRVVDMAKWAETADINTIEMHSVEIGVITSGISYQYAKEALGDGASYLKLGMVYPLPTELIREFASKVKKLYVIEELDDFIETHCKKIGVNVIGKDLFPLCGEYCQSLIREKILGVKTETMSLDVPLPPRPPVMCAGCPHRGVFYAFNRLGVYVSGDIGCYTLGSAAPLAAIDACICMGASVSGAHGVSKAVGKMNGKLPVAVIGDSTFIHSGVTGLINVAYNQAKTVTVILDNSITGMTGHQQNPTTGYTITGEPTAAVDLEALCQAVGIKNIAVTDPYDLPGTLETIKKAVEGDEASVVISRRPCALLKTVKHKAPLRVDNDKCTGCKVCLRIGCPATSMQAESGQNAKMHIDPNQCVGCGQCVSLCKFGAIIGGEDN
ncbi:MAG: indolepyruvate ferredoxin oxidoreductase subunit alpha [Oscillospiraceae bacterium]|jgi:indolepyruvate ferredoxin oxidoreductase alpha subunit|nr:indolepyruvate ferredoxin oxidoreductase subunit alpha [Oscillospiraceae bacterium]